MYCRRRTGRSFSPTGGRQPRRRRRSVRIETDRSDVRRELGVGVQTEQGHVVVLFGGLVVRMDHVLGYPVVLVPGKVHRGRQVQFAESGPTRPL